MRNYREFANALFSPNVPYGIQEDVYLHVLSAVDIKPSEVVREVDVRLLAEEMNDQSSLQRFIDEKMKLNLHEMLELFADNLEIEVYADKYLAEHRYDNFKDLIRNAIEYAYRDAWEVIRYKLSIISEIQYHEEEEE
jgi:hypothetical protein